MRAGDFYECERCDVQGSAAELCEPRCKHARDSNGNAPPPAKHLAQEWFRGTPDQAGAMLVRSVFRLTAALQRVRRRRKLRALAALAGDVVTIASSPEGLTTIEGIVAVLDPVTTPDGNTVAAFAHRSVRTAHRLGSEKLGPATRRDFVRIEHVSLRRETGRFLVEDATGVALIDDDWALLLDEEGHELANADTGGLTVGAGQRVRIFGHCRRGGFSVPAGAGSYRGHALGLEFIGGTGRPVCVQALPTLAKRMD